MLTQHHIPGDTPQGHEWPFRLALVPWCEALFGRLPKRYLNTRASPPAAAAPVPHVPATNNDRLRPRAAQTGELRAPKSISLVNQLGDAKKREYQGNPGHWTAPQRHWRAHGPVDCAPL
ncbi:MAG: hypothetical protein ACI9DC_002846 [Gammaproteobacteria bacterium]|jgi:hypothetical protein